MNYTSLFPPFIFRTNEDKLQKSSFFDFCIAQNPNYQHIIYDDHDRTSFIQQFYPQFIDAFKALPRIVLKADMWRLLILHHYGGLYFDMDVECLRPIDDWGQSFGVIRGKDGRWSDGLVKRGGGDDRQLIQLMVGIEFTPDLFPMAQFATWSIASKPGHPILLKAAEMIVENAAEATTNTEELADNNILHIGNRCLTLAIIEHFVQMGYLANDNSETVAKAPFWHNNITNTLIGDVAVLNKQAWGYHPDHPSSVYEDSEEIFIRHWFVGSWREGRNYNN
jgi:mannosyltransferase OCH1-like enzyme